MPASTALPAPPGLPKGKAPGRYQRDGISLLELANLFPNNKVAVN